MNKHFRLVLLLLCSLLLTAGCSKNIQQQIQKQLELGQKYLLEQNYDEAIIAFQKIIDLDPKVWDAYMGIARGYEGLGNHAGAAAILETGLTQADAASVPQEDIDYLVSIYEMSAQEAMNASDYETALAAFSSALGHDPNRQSALSDRARARVLSGETEENLDQAQADFEAALRLDNTLVSAWLGLADVWIRRGDYDKALEILQQALEACGDDPEIASRISDLENGTIRDSSGRTRRETARDADGTLLYYLEYTYNPDGTEHAVTSYDGDGNVTGAAECSYDAQGRRINGYTISVLNSIEKWVEPTEMTYDSNGRVSKEITYNWSDGSISSITEYDHDANGNPTENRMYRSDGTLQLRQVTEYSAQSKVETVTTYYYSDSGEIFRFDVWSYNSSGALAEMCGYNSDGSLNYKYTYEYDSAGKKTAENIEYTDGKKVSTIYEYDDTGKLIRETVYENGQVVRVSEY